MGATCADAVARWELANEVVLLDIKEGFAEGKALDIWQTAPINLFDSRLVGSTNDYGKTAGSDVVVITSGLPRKPGMSRDDLLATNAKIVGSVAAEIRQTSPDAVVIVVSNPLDAMVQRAWQVTGFPHARVLGQAGALDLSLIHISEPTRPY